MPLTTPEGLLKLIVYLGVRRAGQILLVEYEQAPNPDKPGWWIPAPEVPYGEDPLEQAEQAAASLGFADAKPRLMDVESFTMNGGNWHVLIHYVLDVDADPAALRNVKRWGWFAADRLPAPAEFAHGKWEASLARAMLGHA